MLSYSHDIKEETSLKDFALDCSRNFGALATMSRESNTRNYEIPEELTPDEYYKNNMDDQYKVVEDLKSMTEEDKSLWLKKKYKLNWNNVSINYLKKLLARKFKDDLLKTKNAKFKVSNEFI